jgi:preprotein translocase subunit SecF
MTQDSGLSLARKNVFSRLYHGETDFDFVGRTRLWLMISGAVIVAGLAALFIRGLNLGIDFEGGTVWEVTANGATVADARDALADFGLEAAKIQTVSSDEGDRIRIQSEPLEDPTEAEVQRRDVADALADLTGTEVEEVSVNSVGPTWGGEISRKALTALIVFLVVITLYISLRFEFKMAVATLAALVHDLLVTVGVYALTGFEVTPATVIAVLTILGYSIYDGIVVFDKVDENTRLVSSTRMTYSDMVNLSLNQTVMRSLNTSITAVLPVMSLLIVGSFILGATTLQDFALALLIGLFSGAYSSIFIASPMLAWLKEREPRYRDVRRRMDARLAKTEVEPRPTRRTRKPAEPVEPAETVEAAGATPEEEEVLDAEPVTTGGRTEPARGAPVIPPRPRRKTTKRR